MVAPHPLPESLAELIAQRFRVMGEPMRIRLLDALRDGERSVGALVDHLGGTQQNVSKHLGVLHDAGLVHRSKQGTYVRYSIADASVFSLCDEVCGGLRTQVTDLEQIVTGGTS